MTRIRPGASRAPLRGEVTPPVAVAPAGAAESASALRAVSVRAAEGPLGWE